MFVLIACQTPTVDVDYHVVDSGAPTADAGTDFLSTGTMAAGLAVAIDASSSSGAVEVTSSNTAVLDVLPTTSSAVLIVARQVGSATLDFAVGGDVARAIPVTVVAQ